MANAGNSAAKRRHDELENELEATHARLEEVSARLHQVERICCVGSWEWHLATDTIVCSDELFRLFGYEPQAFHVTPDRYLDMLSRRDRRLVEGVVGRALRHRRSFQFEHDLERPDGAVRHMMARGSVEEDEEGRPSRVFGVFEDVTEKVPPRTWKREMAQERRARTRAAAAERRARLLAHVSTVLDSSLDYDTTISKLAEVLVPELADGCVIDLLESEDKVRSLEVVHREPGAAERIREVHRGCAPDPESPNPMARVMGTKEPALLPEVDRGTLERIAVDEAHLGQLEALRIGSAVVVPLTAREVLLGSLVLLASSPRRRFERDDLQVAQEVAQRASLAIDNARLHLEVQRASRAKSDFLAVMSHELRTPLNAVVGYASLLRAQIEGPLTEGQARQIERIRSSARHLLQLIDEILEYSRLEVGATRLSLQEADLAEIAREAAALIEPVAEEKALDFDLEVPPHQRAEVHTDARKLRQILLNLLSNAVKFTEQGAVVLRLRERTDAFVFQIEDTGIGIDPADRARVFDPFHQIERANRAHIPGTGLGLSVARRLTELLGGELSVESTVGEGTVFTVALPRRPPQG